MGLYPLDLRYYASLTGVPQGPKSNYYLVDPVNGNDASNGTSFRWPLKTVAAAFAKCTGDQHDVVFMLAGDTFDNPAASIAWNKDHTHLIGLSADFPGIGQRCRIEGSAALDLTPVITFSGRGCIVRNIQFSNAKDANTDSGCVVVSGPYNYFKNVYFNGMNHATPAARAGSYCLSVTGAENYFEDCTIGSCQTVRAAANSELIVSNGANWFKHCTIQAYSETAGKFLVTVDAQAAGLGDIIFEDCLFYFQTVNWAAAPNNAFAVLGGNSHFVVLRGNCQLVGISATWADTVTHIYGAGPQPNAGYGISINPTS